MSKLSKALLILPSFVLAWQRLAGEHDQTFQAIAHLWLGMLLGGQVTLFAVRNQIDNASLPAGRAWFAGLLVTALVLSLVELFCFLRPGV